VEVQVPTFTVRKANEVPPKAAASKAVRERHSVFEAFIRDVGGGVGELALGPDEGVRSTKVALRRASTRIGTPITIWDANGSVYFQKEVKRGRPRKAKAA
jgi:hypothetical protein